MSKEEKFKFKNLLVWQKALKFTAKVIITTEQLNTTGKHYRLIEQTEAASASIAQNISEGKGRYSKKEFKNFLYYARGSAYETVTLLNVFHAVSWITDEKLEELENEAFEIISMIKGLINSIGD